MSKIFIEVEVPNWYEITSAELLLNAASVNKFSASLITAPQEAEPKASGKYKTQPAESLMGIALRQLGDEDRWREIYELNCREFPDYGPHDYYPVGSLIEIPTPQAECQQCKAKDRAFSKEIERCDRRLDEIRKQQLSPTHDERREELLSRIAEYLHDIPHPDDGGDSEGYLLAQELRELLSPQSPTSGEQQNG